jgi:hypothetical protein
MVHGTDLLLVNADKTQYMQFITKTSSLIDLHVMYKNKEIADIFNTKFLALTLDNTFTWKNHIDIIVPKLSSVCFTVRAVKPFVSQESLRMVYFSYFHSIMSETRNKPLQLPLQRLPHCIPERHLPNPP